MKGGRDVGETSFSKEAAQEMQKESLQGSNTGFLKMLRQTGHRSSVSMVAAAAGAGGPEDADVGTGGRRRASVDKVVGRGS